MDYKLKHNERLLKLTHEDIELIEFALQFIHDNQIQYTNSKECALPFGLRKTVVENAMLYYNLKAEIENGDKDY